MTTKPAQQQRRDARDNRAQLVRAARVAFAEQGLVLPMREVARRAGLGVATLYRHFPTRDDLVRAAFADQVAACTAFVAEAGADPDPWRGLTSVVAEICRRQAFDHGFHAALLGSPEAALLFAQERDQNRLVLADLVRRGQHDHLIRSDVGMSDLSLLLTATAAITADTPERTELRARRLAALILDGMSRPPDLARSGPRGADGGIVGVVSGR